MNLKRFLSLYKKKFELPLEHSFEKILDRFSLTEKVFFYFFITVFSISAIMLVWRVHTNFLVEVPTKGGSIVEGVIGTPRYINPVLANNDAERDLTMLLYSGLMKISSEGTLELDLARDLNISADGKTYTFKLKERARFHDGKPISADDVIFTVQRAQDPAIKSPRRANWEGVKIEKTDERTIVFSLKQAYAPFLENTTLGIMPKHIWKDLEPEEFPLTTFNNEPIGSGHYKISRIKRNSSGIPSVYELKANNDHVSGEPYIEKIVMQFYSNEDELIKAYRNGDINNVNAISPEQANTLNESGANILQTPLPRIFAVFLNQNQAEVFSSKEVRLALDMAVSKDDIIDKVLFGYGTAIDGPIPAGLIEEENNVRTKADLAGAMALLEKNGWMKNERGIYERKVKNQTKELSFTLTTANITELKQVAEILKEQWQALGANVKLQIFDAGDLNQNVIRPRKYDALLFGEIIGRDMDLFAFWHSTQRNDPGLNIAMYANVKVNKLLEEARTISKFKDRMERFVGINNEIRNDLPAIFLYAPDFIYAMPEDIKGKTLEHITIPSERFADVHKWYIYVDKIWKLFVKD